jgi:putative membrane protein
MFNDPDFTRHLIASFVFALIGLMVFALAFVIMAKSTPFSVRKEIEEDHNTALAIIMASVIIGIALIIGAAIQG